MDRPGLESLSQQLELVKDSIKDTTLAAHKRNMVKGYEMTRVLLEHKISNNQDLLKEEACSPGARNRRGDVTAAAAIVPAVRAGTSRPMQLCYATPPPDMGTWFSTPGVLSCQDELTRAQNHPLFPQFLVETTPGLGEGETWEFGGEGEDNDPYADLYDFMAFVNKFDSQHGDRPEDRFF